MYRYCAAVQVSVGGYDWGMFQFAVVELEAVDHGPNLPQKVWGALDPEGTLVTFLARCELSYRSPACASCSSTNGRSRELWYVHSLNTLSGACEHIASEPPAAV